MSLGDINARFGLVATVPQQRAACTIKLQANSTTRLNGTVIWIAFDDHGKYSAKQSVLSDKVNIHLYC